MVCLNIIQMPSSTLEHLSFSAALPTRPWPSALLSAFWTSKFLLDWLINLCLGHSVVLQPQLQALPHSSLEPVTRTCEPWVHVYHSNSLASQYGFSVLVTFSIAVISSWQDLTSGKNSFFVLHFKGIQSIMAKKLATSCPQTGSRE